MTIRKIYKKVVLYAGLALVAAVSPVHTYARQETLTADTVASDTLLRDTLAWPQSLQARLDSIMDATTILRTSQMGLLVYDLDADSVLYAYNERQNLRPASTMKLITAITALDKLGDSYTFSTQLRRIGTIDDSTRVLKGDVYCIGGMDPMISKEDLRIMARSIKEAGIDTIRGNMYADRSMKDSDLYGEGWCWDDDNPMLSPLVYSRKDDLMSVLRTVMQEEGVVLDGEVSVKNCPGNTKELFTLKRPMSEVMRPMLKNSNNLYAESIYYQIGLAQGKPSTAKKAKAAEETLLKKIGLGDAIHRFADGSGLSLYNYVSAEIEVAFLRYAYDRQQIYTALYQALPIAAVDGTIEKRMAGTAAAGNVHAKTGTLTGVSSLAGYCTAANGHTLCFAIINQGVMKGIYAKNLQDRICVAMCSAEPFYKTEE